MKRIMTKAVTALLAFSMVLSVASCSKKKGGNKGNSGRKITDDTPWFDTVIYDVDQGFDQAY